MIFIKKHLSANKETEFFTPNVELKAEQISNYWRKWSLLYMMIKYVHDNQARPASKKTTEHYIRSDCHLAYSNSWARTRYILETCSQSTVTNSRASGVIYRAIARLTQAVLGSNIHKNLMRKICVSSVLNVYKTILIIYYLGCLFEIFHKAKYATFVQIAISLTQIHEHRTERTWYLVSVDSDQFQG